MKIILINPFRKRISQMASNLRIILNARIFLLWKCYGSLVYAVVNNEKYNFNVVTSCKGEGGRKYKYTKQL